MLNYIKERPYRSLFLFLSLVAMLVPGLLPAGTVCFAAIIDGSRANPATTGTPTGAIDSSSRVIDMSDTIHLLDPNEAPLTAITMKLRKAHCISPKVEWLEDDYLPATVSVSASSTSATSDTVLSFTSAVGIGLRTGDVVQNPRSGENVYIRSVANNTGATVVRNVGGVPTQSTSSSIATTDVLLIVGNANQEGADKRAVKSTTKSNLSNFTQIFRWPFGLTGTLNNTEVYGGSDLNYQTRKAGIEHRISMERAFLFGIKSDDSTVAASNAAPLRFCDGIFTRITTNTSAAPNPLTVAAFETFLQTGMRYGPARKMFFGSRLAMSLLNGLAQAKIVTVPTTSSFPLAITEYVSPHGKIYLVTHNLLSGSAGATIKYGGYGFLLDMDSIFYRYLSGRDTTLRTNIQGNGEDARTDEYLTEACPMVIQEKNHAYINTFVA